MFLHVPSGHNEEEVQRGKKVTLGLLAALVGSEVAKQKGIGHAKGSLGDERIQVMSESDGCL